MRTSLINAYSTRNVGDAAIYHALATLQASREPVACQLLEARPQTIPGVAFQDEAPRDSDLYISVGGDIFNNARPGFITRNFVSGLSSLASVPAHKTIVFGQSIPRSCRSLAFRLLTRRLRKLASVTVRDEESWRRLTGAGVVAQLSYDAAFVLKPSEPGTAAAHVRLAQAGVTPARAAVLSIRGFDAMYPTDNREFLEKISALCKAFTARGLTPVVLMQSFAGGSDNDQAMLDQLVSRVPTVRCIDPFASAYRARPWETAIGVLGLAKVAVAVRYHTAVFRALSGRSPYNLYYSNKGEDLVSRLGMPGTSIQAFDPTRDIDAIMRTAEQRFDIDAIRAELKKDFEAASRRALHRSAA